MLNSTEHGISTDHTVKTTCKILKIQILHALILSDVVFILLIDVKMPTIVGILTFVNRINFMLNESSMEKSFITCGPGPGITMPP